MNSMITCSLPMIFAWVNGRVLLSKWKIHCRVNSNSRFSLNKKNTCQIIKTKRKNSSVIYVSHQISHHLNKLNLKFQGKKMLICNLPRQIWEFISKFIVFIWQVKNNCFIHFSNLNQYAEDLIEIKSII